VSRPVISEFFEQKFVQKVMSKGNTEGTAERYLQQVSTFEDWLETNRGMGLLDAKTPDLRVHIEEMAVDTPDREAYADSTIVTRRSGVSKFFQLAQEIAEDYALDISVPENPSEGLERSWATSDTKKSQGVDATEGIYYLSPDEIRQLEQNVPAPRVRNALIIRLLFNTGLRRGELASISMEAIDRRERTIHIPALKSPEPRTVTYSENYVGLLLSEWLDDGLRQATYYAREKGSDCLFPTNESPHITGYQVNKIIKQSADNAGLQKVVATYADGRESHKVTAHTLRHSYAVKAIDSGIDIRTLQKLLGHEDLDTTMVYLKISEQDIIEESRNFKPFAD
jgi:integrase/recombinase XerD